MTKNTGYGRQDSDLLFLTDDRIRQHIELLFFAYQSFTSDPDRILKGHGFGRAHHRAIHFINRSPGLTVSELLTVLGITKQSLNRVLRSLIEEAYVTQQVGELDRRERNLFLTPEGEKLERELSAAQSARIREAFTKAGPEAVSGFKSVLRHIIDPEAERMIARFVDAAGKME